MVATIGFEETLDSEVVGVDAASEMDATPALASDAGVMADVSVPPIVDATARPTTCWLLPDVVHARAEAGMERVEERDVFGATDKALGCADASTSVDPLAVTYQRNTPQPLLLGGVTYALAAPATSLPPVTVSSYVSAERCMQGAFPSPLLLVPGVLLPFCQNLSSPSDAKALRILIPAATPFPSGLRLCDAPCPAPPP